MSTKSHFQTAFASLAIAVILAIPAYLLYDQLVDREVNRQEVIVRESSWTERRLSHFLRSGPVNIPQYRSVYCTGTVVVYEVFYESGAKDFVEEPIAETKVCK
jgi:hypothetical protein